MSEDRAQLTVDARRLRMIIGVLPVAAFLPALDQTVVATALPTIAGDLGGLSHLSWVVTAYMLSIAVTTPLYGKLGDLYGRKALFQLAISIFLVGSVLCGVSQGMGELIAARALQGIGAGGLTIGSQAVLGDVVAAARPVLRLDGIGVRHQLDPGPADRRGPDPSIASTTREA